MDSRHINFNRLAYFSSVIDLGPLILVAAVLLWLDAGISFGNILLIQAFFGLFVLLLEYPSGVVADLNSRKSLLIIANLSAITGSIVYLFAQSFWVFVLAEFFYAAHRASTSGSDSAMIFDTYQMQDNQIEGKKVLATGNTVKTLSWVITFSAGGLLILVSPVFPFYIMAVGSLVKMVLYFLSTEPQRMTLNSSSQAIRQSFSFLKSSNMIIYVIPSIFVALNLRVAFWAFVPRLQLLKINPGWIGIILAAGNVVTFLSSYAVKKYENYSCIIHYLVIGTLGLIIFQFQTTLLQFLIALALMQLVRGAYTIIIDVQVNVSSSSEIRSSVLSLLSSIGFAFYMLFTLIVNVLAFSQEIILLINSIIGVVFVILLILYKLKPILTGTTHQSIMQLEE